MAQTVMIYLFFNLLSLSFLPWSSIAFTLKLLHRDSPNSPLYQPNISDFQRLKINAEISIFRASLFEATDKANSAAFQSKSLQLRLKFQDPLYTVEIGLGTPVVKQTLIFDTGSGLTWLQCKPCIRCFKQDPPLFNIRKSSSYKRMSKKHNLSRSFKCNVFGCPYYVGYYSGQGSAGVASVESFTFQTNSSSSQREPGLVFGCGTSNFGKFPRQVSGIFGLDKEPISFARQLGSLIKDRFSYCLSETKSQESYLRFGDEAIVRGKNAQVTPLVKTKENVKHYGVNISDIGIGGKKLGLAQGTFPGGCVIDSGASISLLETKAFFAAKNFLTTHFSKYKNVQTYVGKEVPKSFLCYTMPKGFRNFPNMTFHFQGANFHVPWTNLFFILENRFFCLAVISSPSLTILGAFQQRNVRVVYDLKDEMLSFAPEDCSKDKA